jgi:hypothetical protein
MNATAPANAGPLCAPAPSLDLKFRVQIVVVNETRFKKLEKTAGKFEADHANSYNSRS